ncbi:uncharacterized protein EKO05_0002765 [Ascochyta rabiei]|uniref:uncharacterized protein n=1 Tax=Didymella rabiei TaxID=5454 RepID=UPI00220DF152|nr:uncharacterized protein EKO05_0002765 [Ascochyta rabiei]UPX12202.1 hypothetical protein EKO05_0002765 [Ascochyta rabiei]
MIVELFSRGLLSILKAFESIYCDQRSNTSSLRQSRFRPIDRHVAGVSTVYMADL